MTIVPEGAAKPGAEVVLNSSTGLVGMPTQTGAGIYARCLINPSIVVHGRVRIAQKDVNPGAAEINPLTGNNDLGLAQGKRPIFA